LWRQLELIAAVGGHVSVGMEGKAVDAGTAGPRQGGALACVAKARTDAPYPLPGPLAKGNALLHRGGQRPGQLGIVTCERIVTRGHHLLRVRFEIPQRAEGADNAPTDRLKDRGDVRVRWGAAGRKRGLRPWAARSTKTPSLKTQ
jgi:hypothetical protein